MLASMLQVALEVSTLLVIVYAITTSEIGRLLRVVFMRWVWAYTLLICPICTGWWVSVAVAHYLGGNVWMAPLYFMSVPVTQRALPQFLTGPQQSELDAFVELNTPKPNRFGLR